MEEDKILHGILLKKAKEAQYTNYEICLLYTSPSPRDTR